jgi:hypothetical protein
MIAFDRVVGVLLRDVRRGRDEFVEYPQVRGGLVGGHLDRRRPAPQGPGEEPTGRWGVPLLGQQDVDDLAVLVDRPVQVPPPADDLDVGLVDEPAAPGRVPRRTGGLGEQRGEPLHPPVHRHVVDAGFGQQLLHMPVGQPIAQVPADPDRDHRRNRNPANADRSTEGRAVRGRRTCPASSAAPTATTRARSMQQTPPGSGGCGQAVGADRGRGPAATCCGTSPSE